MRILHLTNTINDAGNGITNVMVDLAIGQRRIGHEVAVLSNGGTFEEHLMQSEVQLFRADFTRRRPLAVGLARRRLIQQIHAFKPDVLHAHTLAPTVLALSLGRSRRPPLVATVHNEYQLGSSVMKHADAVVGVSRAVSTAMIGRGAKPERVSTIINGTMGSTRRAGSTASVALSGRSIVAVGAVSHRKGADLLVRALAELSPRMPDLHLYFVGRVDWEEPGRLAEQNELADRVHFVGFTKNPEPYLAAADVFALPSRREPLGLAFLEAHEAGIPAVGSDVDGIPEVLDFGRAGVLVRPDDPGALAEGIARLLTNRELRRTLLEGASRFVADKTVECMTAQYQRLYASIVP